MPILMRSMQVLPYSLLPVRPHGLPRCDVLVTVSDRSNVTVVSPGLKAAVHTDERPRPGGHCKTAAVLIFRGWRFLEFLRESCNAILVLPSSYQPVSELYGMQRSEWHTLGFQSTSECLSGCAELVDIFVEPSLDAGAVDVFVG